MWDLQFEGNDKVEMRLKSTEKKKSLKLGQEKLCVLYNIQSYFFSLRISIA